MLPSQQQSFRCASLSSAPSRHILILRCLLPPFLLTGLIVIIVVQVLHSCSALAAPPSLRRCSRLHRHRHCAISVRRTDTASFLLLRLLGPRLLLLLGSTSCVVELHWLLPIISITAVVATSSSSLLLQQREVHTAGCPAASATASAAAAVCHSGPQLPLIQELAGFSGVLLD